MKKTTTRKKGAPPEEKKAVIPYETTDQEHKAIKALGELARSRPPAPTIKVTEKPTGGTKIESNHPDQITGLGLLFHSFATTSPAFLNCILDQIGNAVSIGPKFDQNAINFALAVIDGIQPKDQLETMLATQMAAIHMATITFVRRLNHVETIDQQDSAERALNKLARTFTTQMEALKKYRTGGEQKVTVHHVTVNEGGQAIVGTVERSKDQGEGGHT